MSKEKLPLHPAPLGLNQLKWLIRLLYVALLITAIAYGVKHSKPGQLDKIVEYQIFAGALLVIAGGSIIGWAVAVFLGAREIPVRRKAAPAPSTSAPNNPAPSPPAPRKPQASTDNEPRVAVDRAPIDSPPSPRYPQVRVLSLTDPLIAIPRVGPERAGTAATFGFQNVGDLIKASPNDLNNLRDVFDDDIERILRIALQAAAYARTQATAANARAPEESR